MTESLHDPRASQHFIIVTREQMDALNVLLFQLIKMAHEHVNPLFVMPHAPVVSYVTEEVSRQGHDVRTLDGLQRVAWMLDAWCHAIRMSERPKPTVGDAIALGSTVERVKNYHGIRTCGVRVGSRVCPPPERVDALLLALFGSIDVLSPLEFYKGFEEIHPFVDGNGRTGKILLNWLNGTLLEPVFPPSDLWGHDIRNP